jgi:hypothetical protein
MLIMIVPSAVFMFVMLTLTLQVSELLEFACDSAKHKALKNIIDAIAAVR